MANPVLVTSAAGGRQGKTGRHVSEMLLSRGIPVRALVRQIDERSENLRALGANRTLVLLDGQRIVPTTAIGTVDISLIPEGLIKRIDIVTGGASAAFGSDGVRFSASRSG